jgi:hypothetical protein
MTRKNLSKDKFEEDLEQLNGSEEMDEWPIDPDGVDSLDIDD